MQWNLDPAHSSIEFSVKHLGIATVRGKFRKFAATAETGPDGRLERVDATIDAASIDTGVDQRDEHLRSADFFDVARHPEIRFASTGIAETGAGEVVVTGELTLRGVTRPVRFTLEQGGAIKDPWGQQRIASRHREAEPEGVGAHLEPTPRTRGRGGERRSEVHPRGAGGRGSGDGRIEVRSEK